MLQEKNDTAVYPLLDKTHNTETRRCYDEGAAVLVHVLLRGSVPACPRQSPVECDAIANAQWKRPYQIHAKLCAVLQILICKN